MYHTVTYSLFTVFHIDFSNIRLVKYIKDNFQYLVHLEKLLPFTFPHNLTLTLGYYEWRFSEY